MDRDESRATRRDRTHPSSSIPIRLEKWIKFYDRTWAIICQSLLSFSLRRRANVLCPKRGHPPLCQWHLPHFDFVRVAIARCRIVVIRQRVLCPAHHQNFGHYLQEQPPDEGWHFMGRCAPANGQDRNRHSVIIIQLIFASRTCLLFPIKVTRVFATQLRYSLLFAWCDSKTVSNEKKTKRFTPPSMSQCFLARCGEYLLMSTRFTKGFWILEENKGAVRKQKACGEMNKTHSTAIKPVTPDTGVWSRLHLNINKKSLTSPTCYRDYETWWYSPMDVYLGQPNLCHRDLLDHWKERTPRKRHNTTRHATHDIWWCWWLFLCHSNQGLLRTGFGSHSFLTDSLLPSTTTLVSVCVTSVNYIVHQTFSFLLCPFQGARKHLKALAKGFLYFMMGWVPHNDAYHFFV